MSRIVIPALLGAIVGAGIGGMPGAAYKAKLYLDNSAPLRNVMSYDAEDTIASGILELGIVCGAATGALVCTIAASVVCLCRAISNSTLSIVRAIGDSGPPPR
jgi:hypothetical protein